MSDQNNKKDTIEVPIILLKKMAKYDRTARKILREHFHVPPTQPARKVNPEEEMKKEQMHLAEQKAKTEDELFELNGKKVNEETLRAMAKEAGIKNWHNKKPENLVEELSSEGVE